MSKSLPFDVVIKMLENLSETPLEMPALIGLETYSEQRVRSRLDSILNSTSDKLFAKLLSFISMNEDDSLAIMQDDTCKNILLTKRPTCLPHWIISLGISQPHVIPFLLKDDEYKNSLSPAEFDYLLENVPGLKEFVMRDNIVPPSDEHESTETSSMCFR
ncbi:Uncharacterised protein (plasmid) [Legionella adelaidensis]|uniref:Uncharacterized protein n=1 Tax=Legionella adelaidensis TaxID=45056 RepID=A0A0W0R251_9GAMM|nr:hypothetical protein [Legionella adelaidensis]KTC65049.1 hypothetical protein Lade_1572 [Legionella adelaidensis]VEH85432.1 Uncharacterised protein [Legionella adelaidensis]